MEFIAMLLFVVFIALLTYPTVEDEETPKIDFNRCQEPHVWVRRPTGFDDDSYYLMCGVCGYVPHYHEED